MAAAGCHVPLRSARAGQLSVSSRSARTEAASRPDLSRMSPASRSRARRRRNASSSAPLVVRWRQEWGLAGRGPIAVEEGGRDPRAPLAGPDVDRGHVLGAPAGPRCPLVEAPRARSWTEPIIAATSSSADCLRCRAPEGREGAAAKSNISVPCSVWRKVANPRSPWIRIRVPPNFPVSSRRNLAAIWRRRATRALASAATPSGRFSGSPSSDRSTRVKRAIDRLVDRPLVQEAERLGTERRFGAGRQTVCISPSCARPNGRSRAWARAFQPPGRPRGGETEDLLRRDRSVGGSHRTCRRMLQEIEQRMLRQTRQVRRAGLAGKDEAGATGRPVDRLIFEAAGDLRHPRDAALGEESDYLGLVVGGRVQVRQKPEHRPGGSRLGRLAARQTSPSARRGRGRTVFRDGR